MAGIERFVTSLFPHASLLYYINNSAIPIVYPCKESKIKKIENQKLNDIPNCIVLDNAPNLTQLDSLRLKLYYEGTQTIEASIFSLGSYELTKSNFIFLMSCKNSCLKIILRFLQRILPQSWLDVHFFSFTFAFMIVLTILRSLVNFFGIKGLAYLPLSTTLCSFHVLLILYVLCFQYISSSVC